MNNNSSNKTHVMYLASGLCYEAHSRIRGGRKTGGLQSRNAMVSWGWPPACVCSVILAHSQKGTWGTLGDGALTLCSFFIFIWPLCLQNVARIAGIKNRLLLIVKDNMEAFPVVNPNCACLLNISI